MDSRLTASGGPAWHCSTPSSRARSPSCRSTAPADMTEERNRGKNKINAHGQCDVHPLFRPCIPHTEPSSHFSPNPSLSRVMREREGQRQTRGLRGAEIEHKDQHHGKLGVMRARDRTCFAVKYKLISSATPRMSSCRCQLPISIPKPSSRSHSSLDSRFRSSQI
jgi:hypothetical protein